jgi:DNA-binding MarR family transcriptional regulator
VDRRTRLREQVLHNHGRLLTCMRLPEAQGFMALELTMPQFKTLVLLDARESAVVGQLARGLGVGLSTSTGSSTRGWSRVARTPTTAARRACG